MGSCLSSENAPHAPALIKLILKLILYLWRPALLRETQINASTDCWIPAAAKGYTLLPLTAAHLHATSAERNGSCANAALVDQQLERERTAPSLTAAMSASSWAGVVPIWCARPSCEYLEKGVNQRMCALEGES